MTKQITHYRKSSKGKLFSAGRRTSFNSLAGANLPNHWYEYNVDKKNAVFYFKPKTKHLFSVRINKKLHTYVIYAQDFVFSEGATIMKDETFTAQFARQAAENMMQILATKYNQVRGEF